MTYHPPVRLSIFSRELLVPAIGASFTKLDPRQLIRNPVMFTTAVVALLLTLLMVGGIWDAGIGFQIQLVVWLWLTVLFGNFAEAMAEGRGKAQAASLRDTKTQLTAKKLRNGCPQLFVVAHQRLLPICSAMSTSLSTSCGQVIDENWAR